MSKCSLKSCEEIRKRAEARAGEIPDSTLPENPEDVRKLVHQLRVHQIELEMQNEELRKTQQDLEASRDRYTQLYHQAPIGYLTISRDGIIVEANYTLAGMLGVSLDRLRERPLSELILPEDRGVFFGRFQAFFNQPKGKSIELRLLRNDETAFYSRIEGCSASFSEAAEGNRSQKQLLVIAHDISDRKNWEDKLRNYEKMVTSANDFIALIDPSYVLQVMNQSYAAAFGCRPDELKGRTLSDLYGQEVFEEKLKPHFRDGFAGQEVHFKEWFDLPHLKRRFLDSACYPIVEADRTVSGVVVIKRDITRMKSLEDQLIQAQKMEAVGTLAGGIAHDFNNLMMGIQGRASLMLLDLDELSPNYNHLKRIEECIKSGASLTQRLLGFARGGKYETRLTDLNLLVQKQLEMFVRTRKEIRVHIELDGSIYRVEVDRNQMQQVLLNLFVNAWQAMPDGGELYIQTANTWLSDDHSHEYKVTPGRYICLTVRDTGIGMDNKTCQRIFEPFFTTKPMGRGTGMGLASVYGIIKNHSGYIDVTSQLHEGTTFAVYLPAAEQHTEISEIKSGEDIEERKTILLVDDEAVVLDVGRQMLERLGYDVITAGSGDEALRVYAQLKDKIDLVLLDIIMPGLSGGETFDRLKTISSDIKVLLASGYSLDAKAADILQRGCDGFIQKPYSLEQLSQKLTTILGS